MRKLYMTEKRGRTRSMPLETQNPGKYKRSKGRASLGVAGESLGVAGEIDKPEPVSPPCSHGLGHRADPVYGRSTGAPYKHRRSGAFGAG